MHVRAATNYSVVSWGGAAFNATNFFRPELLTQPIYDERFQTEHYTAFDVYLLLSTHVVFYCSLRLAPRCLASTLVLI